MLANVKFCQMPYSLQQSLTNPLVLSPAPTHNQGLSVFNAKLLTQEYASRTLRSNDKLRQKMARALNTITLAGPTHVVLSCQDSIVCALDKLYKDSSFLLPIMNEINTNI